MAHQQCLLGQAEGHSQESQGGDDEHSDSGDSGSTIIIENEMIITSATGNTPPVGDAAQAKSVIPPTGEEPSQVMEVDPPLGSHVSPN